MPVTPIDSILSHHLGLFTIELCVMGAVDVVLDVQSTDATDVDVSTLPIDHDVHVRRQFRRIR